MKDPCYFTLVFVAGVVTVKARPSPDEVIQLRGLLLAFMDRVITSSGEILEDEMQCFLNFVTTVNEVPQRVYL